MDTDDRALNHMRTLLAERVILKMALQMKTRLLEAALADSPKDKQGLRDLVLRLEKERSPRDCRAVCQNLPCYLYLAGHEVPLPDSADDEAWLVRWQMWISEHHKKVHDDMRLFGETTLRETFESKQKMFAVLSAQRWDRLRRWTGLPPCLRRQNKMSV